MHFTEDFSKPKIIYPNMTKYTALKETAFNCSFVHKGSVLPVLLLNYSSTSIEVLQYSLLDYSSTCIEILQYSLLDYSSTCIGLLQYFYWITPVLLLKYSSTPYWITPVLLLNYSSTPIGLLQYLHWIRTKIWHLFFESMFSQKAQSCCFLLHF